MAFMTRRVRRGRQGLEQRWISAKFENAAKHETLPGKQSVRRALRAFFLFGYTSYRGNAITCSSQLSRFFSDDIVREVREAISHLRIYWATKEGSLSAESVTDLLSEETSLLVRQAELLRRPQQDAWTTMSLSRARERLETLHQRLYSVGVLDIPNTVTTRSLPPLEHINANPRLLSAMFRSVNTTWNRQLRQDDWNFLLGRRPKEVFTSCSYKA